MNDILKKILRGVTQLIELLNELKLRLPLAPVTRDNCGSNFVCNSDSFISSLEVDDIVFTDKDGDKYTTTQQFDHSLIVNQLSKGDVARVTADEAIVHHTVDPIAPPSVYADLLDPTDLELALRNLRDGSLIPDSPHPAYALLDATLTHIEHLEGIEKALGDESSGFEAQAIEMTKKYGYARKAKDQLKHKNEKLCDKVDSLEQRIRGYEADLDGSTRMITAFRNAFTEVSSTVDNVMPNGGLGDDDDDDADAPF